MKSAVSKPGRRSRSSSSDSDTYYSDNQTNKRHWSPDYRERRERKDSNGEGSRDSGYRSARSDEDRYILVEEGDKYTLMDSKRRRSPSPPHRKRSSSPPRHRSRRESNDLSHSRDRSYSGSRSMPVYVREGYYFQRQLQEQRRRDSNFQNLKMYKERWLNYLDRVVEKDLENVKEEPEKKEKGGVSFVIPENLPVGRELDVDIEVPSKDEAPEEGSIEENRNIKIKIRHSKPSAPNTALVVAGKELPPRSNYETPASSSYGDPTTGSTIKHKVKSIESSYKKAFDSYNAMEDMLDRCEQQMQELQAQERMQKQSQVHQRVVQVCADLQELQKSEAELANIMMDSSTTEEEKQGYEEYTEAMAGIQQCLFTGAVQEIQGLAVGGVDHSYLLSLPSTSRAPSSYAGSSSLDDSSVLRSLPSSRMTSPTPSGMFQPPAAASVWHAQRENHHRSRRNRKPLPPPPGFPENPN